ncbi:MAG: hypothetical protein MUF04_09225 [Akkermansiaceae bacterium]|nr:hypothetical protein [Akkermansiaceae bacterium]
MKHKLQLTTTMFLALFASPLACAADDHDHSKEEHHEHDESVSKGPNGGHVITSKAGFAFEVVVDKDRKARVTFLDKDLKPLPLGTQSITGIAGERSAPTKLTFAKGKDKDANTLISDKPLPPGAHVQMILVIKPEPDAKAVTERFELHLH